LWVSKTLKHLKLQRFLINCYFKATKSDCESERQVAPEDGKKMVESLDNLLQPTFIETSALTGHNVEQAFITLIE